MKGQHDPAAIPDAPPRTWVRRVLGTVALLLVVLFAGLGSWQVQRLQWKLDLIARVDSRVHAAPAAPPPAARWAHVSAAADEYRHVRLAGSYLYAVTTPVQAVTELGNGYWLLTPLCMADGSIVLVNRGFIPATIGADAGYAARRADGKACAHAGAPATVDGLLRISEPRGGFLRNNDAAHNRWYSRDVQAIAAARGLANVAPYFIDAARGQDAAGAPDRPVGGLTVISFPNNHLVYAITWYALALMVAAAGWWALRAPRQGGPREDK